MINIINHYIFFFRNDSKISLLLPFSDINLNIIYTSLYLLYIINIEFRIRSLTGFHLIYANKYINKSIYIKITLIFSFYKQFIIFDFLNINYSNE